MTCESRFGTLLMGADAVSCGRGDDRRQPLFQWAMVAADEANLAVILSRQAFDQVVRPGGVSLREPDFRRVTVAEKEYSTQAWLRVPGLGPDELAVGDAMDHTVSLAAATAGDAAGGYLRSS